VTNNRQRGVEKRRAEAQEADDAASNPLLAALAAAEWDDEPYSDEQQASAEAGREEIRRGESLALEEVKMRFASRPESRLRALT
jgi:hypothetical protein